MRAAVRYLGRSGHRGFGGQSGPDRQLLDQYLESVRNVEREIARAEREFKQAAANRDLVERGGRKEDIAVAKASLSAAAFWRFMAPPFFPFMPPGPNSARAPSAASTSAKRAGSPIRRTS
jgi:hypothetical protein